MYILASFYFVAFNFHNIFTYLLRNRFAYQYFSFEEELRLNFIETNCFQYEILAKDTSFISLFCLHFT